MSITRLVPILVCVALLAGCGGDDDDGSERSSEDAKREFVQRADAICTRAREKSPAAPSPRDLDRFADYADEIVRIADEGFAEFKRLTPPEEDRVTFESFVVAAKDRQDDVRAAGRAARRGDRSGLAAALREESTVHAPRYRQLAKQLGFKVCGSGG
jgi:hypothetical protein